MIRVPMAVHVVAKFQAVFNVHLLVTVQSRGIV